MSSKSMMSFDRKKHWETIYKTKETKDVSWFQPTPETSLSFIKEFNIPLGAKIIDIGGGDSLLVDHLLDLGYQDLTVLDISAAALEKTKKRLGDRARQVQWIVADIAQYQPTEAYDFWHDRAAFHFLTEEEEIQNYVITLHNSLNPEGIALIGTFSLDGPEKCSGIAIKQYSEATLTDRLAPYLDKIKCVTLDHITPSKMPQNFIFCCFRKL
jgi:SAM-dependent methyltransferase